VRGRQAPSGHDHIKKVNEGGQQHFL